MFDEGVDLLERGFVEIGELGLNEIESSHSDRLYCNDKDDSF